MLTKCKSFVFVCSLCALPVIEDSAMTGEPRSREPLPDYLTPQNYPRVARDQYCAAYVVWHALHYYGIDEPLDGIISGMAIDGKKGASVGAVVRALNSYGLRAEAGKVDLANLPALRDPFIPFLPPQRRSQRGHFIFAVPTGGALSKVFDGPRAPYEIDLADPASIPDDRAAWDGISILLGSVDRAEQGGRLLTLALAIPILVASSVLGRWLGTCLSRASPKCRAVAS